MLIEVQTYLILEVYGSVPLCVLGGPYSRSCYSFLSVIFCAFSLCFCIFVVYPDGKSSFSVGIVKWPAQDELTDPHLCLFIPFSTRFRGQSQCHLPLTDASALPCWFCLCSARWAGTCPIPFQINKADLQCKRAIFSFHSNATSY